MKNGRQSRLEEVKSGFRIILALALGMAWLGLVFGGLAIAFTPSPYSRMIGWLLLIGAAAILIVTMDWWAKAFPAIIGWGVIGGLFTIVDGHAVNHPEVLVTHLDAAIMTTLFAASAAVSLTLSHKHGTSSCHIMLRLMFFLAGGVSTGDASIPVSGVRRALVGPAL